MTFIGKLLLVSIISSFALIGSLGASNPWPGFICLDCLGLIYMVNNP